MGFLDKILNRGKEQTVAKSFSDEVDFTWKDVNFNGGDFHFNNDSLSQYKGWVFRCIKLIAQEFSTMQIELMKGDREYEGKEKAEIMRVLDRPNSLQTWSKLLQATQSYLELLGKCFWYIPKFEKSDKPAEIWILRPDLVKIVNSGDISKPILKYIYTINGKQIEFKPEEVIPFLDFNPKSILGAVGSTQAGAEAIDTDNEIKKWNNKFFKNSARPDIVLEYDGQMDDAKYNQTIEKWERKHKGADKAHKPAILSGGLKMSKWNFNQKEMDFIEQRRFGRDEIFTIFGVPKGLMISEDVNLSNSQSALWHFLRFTVKPKMEDFVDVLNEFYINRYYPTLGVKFVLEDPVPEDRKAKIDEYNIAVNKWLTVNEVREMEGYDPVDGGDVLLVGMGMTPIGMAGEKPEPTADPEPNGEPQDGQGDANEPKADGKMINKLAGEIGGILATEDFEHIGEEIHKGLMKRTETTEEYIKREIIDEFERQANEVIHNLTIKKSGNIGETKAKASELLNKETSLDAIVSILTEAEMANILSSGEEALKIVGTSRLFDIEAPRVKSFIERNVGKASKVIVDSTYQKLRASLAEAEKEGEGIDKMTARINALFDDMKVYRAERIARSETMRSANFGLEEGWKQSGVVVGKQWWTAIDERVCNWCGAMHGVVQPIGKNYFGIGDSLVGLDGSSMAIDYMPITAGALHSNCRCVITPVLEGDKSYEHIITEQKIKAEVRKQTSQIKGEVEKEVVGVVEEIIKNA